MTKLPVNETEQNRAYCTFERGGRALSVPVWAVRGVVSGEPATPVPQGPPHVVGVINVRGESLPLVLIDEWVGVPRRSYCPTDPILVLESNDVQMGVVVDSVHSVQRLMPGGSEPLPSNAGRGSIVVDMPVNGDESLAIVDPSRLVETAVALAADTFGRRAATGQCVPVSRDDETS